MSENREIAKQVIEAIGGKENIASFAHCATRLRIMVHEQEKIDQSRVEGIDKVKGAFFNSGQFQIIFGTGTVNRIYEEVEKLGVSGTTKDEMKAMAKKQGNVFQRAIRTFGDVFVPIIPVLVATGLFMGLRGLLTQEQILALLGLTPGDISPNFLLFTQVLTDTAFAFLPALVAWSAFRVFGGSPVLGIVLGLMLVNPALPNAYGVADGSAEALTMLGFIKVVGYQGSVLPAFFVGFIGAKFERFLRKRVPEALDLIVTPFITLLVMITLGLFVIGPVFHSVEEWVLHGTIFVLDMPLGIAGLLIGFFQQIVVVTGVHHIFNLLEIQLLEQRGSNPFNAIITCAMAAQGAACLAVGFKTKNVKLKALALPSSFSAFLGITEPAIFGVNLRYMKPFIMGLVGGGVGGFLASLFGLSATGMAVTVIPGTLLYLNSQLPLYILCNLVAMLVAFILTWFFGFKDQMLAEVQQPAASGASASAVAQQSMVEAASVNTVVEQPKQTEERASAISVEQPTEVTQALTDVEGIQESQVAQVAQGTQGTQGTQTNAVTPQKLQLPAPIAGTIIPLEQVPDPAFAGKHMGDGYAIQPAEGKVYAPFDGTVAHLMGKSNHAIILEQEHGVQLLIHVGIDTVSLKGAGFTAHVKTGDSVKAGQLLLEFDMDHIQQAGLSTITPVIVPSGLEAVASIEVAASSDVKANQETVLALTLKA